MMIRRFTRQFSVALALCLCGSFLSLSVGTSAANEPIEQEQSFHISLTDNDVQLPGSIKTLNDRAAFTFAVMSDNKGDSPDNSTPMKNCVDQVDSLKARFIIGLGDHLTHRRAPKTFPNSFVGLLKTNRLWQRHFYPNIADGENAYYGRGQDDWGAGGQLLTDLKMKDWPEVSLRDNGCEYYAKVELGNHIVHVVQLHYSDNPRDPKQAFREDSRRYMVETLNRIDKKNNRDLVIVCAHTGNWPGVLSREHRKALFDKADLIFGATTHKFQRYPYADDLPLVINTGAVGHRHPDGPHNGWVSAHVFDNPFCVLLQYQNSDEKLLRTVRNKQAFVKVIGRKTHAVRFVATNDSPNKK